MLNIKLPKAHYKKGTPDAANFTYPNLDDRFDGAPVPIRIGDLHNIVPVCIDTAAQTYKVAGHGIHAITAVRTERETLAPADYTTDLANGELSIAVATTPSLAAGTYWFVIEADFDVSAANYIAFSRWDKTASEQSSYSIDGSDVWTEDANHYLEHAIYGRDTLDGPETRRIGPGRKPYWSLLALRDNAARTRIAQKFIVTSGFLVTRIQMEYRRVGTPSGTIKISILSDDSPEVQVGAKSIASAVISGTWWFQGSFLWPLRSVELSALYCDIEGAEEVGNPGTPITTVAETLKYLTQTVLGKPAALLDATYLSDLATDRTQTVKLNIDYETTVGEIVGTLESGQLWKLVPLLDGTYGTVVYEAGEPANTPHFHDEDYLSFRMWQDYGAVKYKTVVKYDKGADQAGEYKTESATSDIARFFYLNEETLEVETCLRASAGATWLAGALSGMYAQPPLMVEFEVHGWGLDLIPGRDKVKLTRTRAMYAGGTLNAVLFRILCLRKRPGTSTTVITAILDSQSY